MLLKWQQMQTGEGHTGIVCKAGVNLCGDPSADAFTEHNADVDQGRDRITYYPSPSGWGFGHPYYSRFGYYGASSPFFYGWDDSSWYGGGGIRDYTEYKSELTLAIRVRGTNQPLFDGRAQARSTDDELGVLVPNLVEAMFTGFPGRNGETVKITVPARRR